jgi:hypothetical protein
MDNIDKGKKRQHIGKRMEICRFFAFIKKEQDRVKRD